MISRNNYITPSKKINKENRSIINNIPFRNSLKVHSKDITSKISIIII